MDDDRKSRTPRQRAVRRKATQSYRQRRRAAGDRLVLVWMTPETQKHLARCVQVEGYTTESAIAGALAWFTRPH